VFPSTPELTTFTSHPIFREVGRPSPVFSDVGLTVRGKTLMCAKLIKQNKHSFRMESLETRRLLAAATAWSTQDQLIGLDKAAADYPTITGKGETVALIDAGGVDYTNPALGGGYGSGFKVVTGFNFTTNSSNIMPAGDDSHATGSAGQLAANPHVVNGQLYQGVAPGVNLAVLIVQTTADAINALNWIQSNRSQLNIVAADYVEPGGQINVTDLVPQLQTLRNENVFVAGAVGNYGPSPAFAVPDHLIYMVGSVDLDNQLSSFTPRGSAIDMVAPGGNVEITWYANGQSENTTSSGTSWAGPQVVGAAALIRQVDPSATPDQILSILQQSATWVYDSTSNRSYPELNVDAALRLTYKDIAPAPVSTPAPTPTPPPAPTPPPTQKPQPTVTTTPPTVSSAETLDVSTSDETRTSIDLSFPLDEVSGMKVIIERRSSTGGFRILKLSHEVSSTNSSTDKITDSHLAAGTTYLYRVQIITSHGKRYEVDATASTLSLKHQRHHFGHHHAAAA
jgi:hypothetical protein